MKYKLIINQIGTSYTSEGAFQWLNREESRKLKTNVNRLKFDKLYPNLFLLFYDAGHLKSFNISLDKIDKIRLLTDATKESSLRKIDYNRTFINELTRTRGRLIEVFHKYMKNIYTDLILSNDNILYIDVDSIFYTGEINQLLLDNFKYTTTNVEQVFFIERAKYIFLENEKYNKRGIIRDNDFSEVVNTMKKELRILKINDVLL